MPARLAGQAAASPSSAPTLPGTAAFREHGVTRRKQDLKQMGETLHALAGELADLARSVDRLSAELLREWARCRRVRRRLIALEEVTRPAPPRRR